ncbi:hypothetical protein L5F64_00245 [Aliarcobacter butzleri]|uniref:hypothetical protein n=1 Tax=Aliarcobacter butzleri TaxID=28197 RepID=UPI001EDADAD6|nr:hypothetical protein [Aliarcobacter butzleri]MCG3711537.1 hypothetical protein [Aliarcobacter butzleri]MCG3713989.1 hypothetical protein [Aliarcobacter butzleri]
MKKSNSSIGEIINGIFLIFLSFGIGGALALFINTSSQGFEKYISQTALTYMLVCIFVSLLLQIIFKISINTNFILMHFIVPFFILYFALGFIDLIGEFANFNNTTPNKFDLAVEELTGALATSIPYVFSTLYFIVVVACIVSNKYRFYQSKENEIHKDEQSSGRYIVKEDGKK